MHYWVKDKNTGLHSLVSTVTLECSTCSLTKPLQVDFQGQTLAKCWETNEYDKILETNKSIESGNPSELTIIYAHLLLRYKDSLIPPDKWNVK